MISLSILAAIRLDRLFFPFASVFTFLQMRIFPKSAQNDSKTENEFAAETSLTVSTFNSCQRYRKLLDTRFLPAYY